MSITSKVYNAVRKRVTNSQFSEDELQRFEKTGTYKLIDAYHDDRFIAKDLKKGEYASLKKKNYELGKKDLLTDENKEIMMQKMFRQELGYDLNLKDPRSFNEKIAWMKLYYQNPLITRCGDRLAVKDYVRNMVGEEYAVPTLGSWTNADHIDFEKMPDKFVIKVNGADNESKTVKDKSKEDLKALQKRIKRWMKPYSRDYYQTFDWGNRNVHAMVFAEPYFARTGRQKCDYGFFCFDGKVRFVSVASGRPGKEGSSIDLFDANFEHITVTCGDMANAGEEPAVPENFEKMKELAAKLAKPFPFVRVDFFEAGENLFVEGMAFYPAGGLLAFEPAEWDYKLGEFLTLPQKLVPVKDDYYHKLTPKECFILEDKITLKEKKQYCIEKAYAQIGYYPNLRSPKSFNEKIIWLALYYRNPDIRIAADKETAKQYIAQRVGKEHVVPLIGAYEDLDDIDFDALPEKFVCKANSGWAANEVMIVENKNTCCFDYLKTIMSNWLYPWNSYYYQNMCITDEKLEAKVVIEQFLESDDGKSLVDYKFYCCNGEPKFALVVQGRDSKQQTRTFVDLDWEYLPVARKGRKTGANIPRPSKLDEMIQLSRTLSENFPLVRIDFYEAGGRVYVGEMTFTPGMFLGLRPIEMDFKLGEELDLTEYMGLAETN